LVCSDSGRGTRIRTDQALRAGRGGILFVDFGLLISHRGVGPYGPEAELRYKRVFVCNGGRCFIFPLSLNRQDAKDVPPQAGLVCSDPERRIQDQNTQALTGGYWLLYG